MENLTYEKVIEHFGGNTAVALALGIIKPHSSKKQRARAGARIGMWKHMPTGIPKNARAKLIVLMEKSD